MRSTAGAHLPQRSTSSASLSSLTLQENPGTKCSLCIPTRRGPGYHQLRSTLLEPVWSDRDGDFPMPRRSRRNHMQQPTPRTLSRTTPRLPHHGFHREDYLYAEYLCYMGQERRSRRRGGGWASSDKRTDQDLPKLITSRRNLPSGGKVVYHKQL